MKKAININIPSILVMVLLVSETMNNNSDDPTNIIKSIPWKLEGVIVPKITIGRKKLKIPVRLKITEWSKNYGLKIPVRVRVRACVCACV